MIVNILWLIPVLPLLAAGVSALLKREHRKLSASLAILSMLGALSLSIWAFFSLLPLSGHGEAVRQVVNFEWFRFGDPRLLSATALSLGWVLDPLTAVMLVMVSFVGLLIFI